MLCAVPLMANKIEWEGKKKKTQENQTLVFDRSQCSESKVEFQVENKRYKCT